MIDHHVTDCTRFWCNSSTVGVQLNSPVQIRETALWVLGVNGCTSALQAEGNRFDTDKIHLTKLIGRGNVQKDVSVGVTTR
jgi:hypothetical protein